MAISGLQISLNLLIDRLAGCPSELLVDQFISYFIVSLINHFYLQFKDPITSAWILKNGCVRPLTLVTSVPPFFDPAVVDQNRQLIYIGEHAHEMTSSSMLGNSGVLPFASCFSGQFDDQLYIQRASKLSYPPMINRFPHVTFRPLLISGKIIQL
jgi:hypothetical protein